MRENVIINIKGMSCKSCVDKIESKLVKRRGVERVKVNLIDNNAFVEFNPEEIGLNDIKSGIADLGYSVDDIKKARKQGLWQGIAYGLIPHIGCIAFIIGSVLGVTVLMQFFKPFLMNRYFFYILILISLMFATISAVLYLRKNGFLSLAGIKRKWRYVLTMYGSTIGINLLLFMVIFPLLANVSVSAPLTGNAISTAGYVQNDLSIIKLKVDIPCPGHAPLISQELKSIDGIADIKFGFPNIFDVKYDASKASKQQILSLDVFNTYKAIVLEESTGQQSIQKLDSQAGNQPISGASCCGSASCGSSGGCGCGFR